MKVLFSLDGIGEGQTGQFEVWSGPGREAVCVQKPQGRPPQDQVRAARELHLSEAYM